MALSPLAGKPAPVAAHLREYGRLDVSNRDRPDAGWRPRPVQRHTDRGQLRLGHDLHLPLRHPVAEPVCAQPVRVAGMLGRDVQAVQLPRGPVEFRSTVVKPFLQEQLDSDSEDLSDSSDSIEEPDKEL